MLYGTLDRSMLGADSKLLLGVVQVELRSIRTIGAQARITGFVILATLRVEARLAEALVTVPVMVVDRLVDLLKPRS